MKIRDKVRLICFYINAMYFYKTVGNNTIRHMMETESGCGINRTKEIGVVWLSQKNGRW